VNVRETNQLLRGGELSHLPCIENAYFFIEDGKISAYGEMRQLSSITKLMYYHAGAIVIHILYLLQAVKKSLLIRSKD
jgi:hypothetical protein